MVPRPLVGPCLIVGEGEDDEAFFRHLVEQRNLNGFQVAFPGKPESDTGGKKGFGQLLVALRVLEGFEKISGIVIVTDSDDDAGSAFAKLREQIESAETYPVPDRPFTIATRGGSPDIAVVLLPEADQPGNLETLCLGAALDKWFSLRPCVEDFVRCTNAESWPKSKLSKLQMRCFLSAACKSDPYTPLKWAWSRPETLIPLDHSAFDRITSFLNSFRANYK
ncbi:MAG: DUF3226 domain-containing protein [Nitrospirota bacterium]